MKKRLNVLCLLTLVILAVKIIFEMKECVTFTKTIGYIALDSDNTTINIIMGVIIFILSVLLFYPTVRGMVSFIRFILNVNRDKIFVRENVSLLRWAGGALLYMSIMVIPAILINQRVEPPTRAINVGSAFLFESLPIILGFVFLIIAEVFVIGIKLREEQELTI